MPLDGHSYLVSQGWGGKGTGLRDGSISRPIIIAQKKNLAGLGKDRDEAFPFWDHLFSAAASAIKLKLDDSGAETSHSEEGKKKVGSTTLKRTKTGIICNRRPIDGQPAHSGSDTTDSPEDGNIPRYRLLVQAKREAAKKGLYSCFFRGPTLGPDTSLERGVKESSPKPQYPSEDAVSSSKSAASVGAMMLQKRAKEKQAVVTSTKRKRDLDGDEKKEKKKKKKDKDGKLKKKDKRDKDASDFKKAKRKKERKNKINADKKKDKQSKSDKSSVDSDSSQPKPNKKRKRSDTSEPTGGDPSLNKKRKKQRDSEQPDA